MNKDHSRTWVEAQLDLGAINAVQEFHYPNFNFRSDFETMKEIEIIVQKWNAGKKQ